MINKNFAIIVGIQLVGALVIAGVLLSDRLNMVGTLMFLAICMTVITFATMSVIAFMLGPDSQSKIKNRKIKKVSLGDKS